MSDISKGPGWWLASDGKWYPPTAVPGDTGDDVGSARLVGARASLPGKSVPPTLALVLQLVLGLAAVVELLAAVSAWTARSRYEAIAVGSLTAHDVDRWIDADELMGMLSLVALAVGVIGTVILTAWMWRAHGATERLRPGMRKWSRGWTIGGWLIPIANLFIPKRVLNEIEKIACAPRDGGVVRQWGTHRTAALGWLWWLGLVGASVLSSVVDAEIEGFLESGRFTPDDILGAYSMLTITYLVGAVALACGAVHFGRVSRRLSPAAFDASNTATPVG